MGAESADDMLLVALCKQVVAPIVNVSYGICGKRCAPIGVLLLVVPIAESKHHVFAGSYCLKPVKLVAGNEVGKRLCLNLCEYLTVKLIP